MTETVYLNDGSVEVITKGKDALWERLIREKVGDDAALSFSDYIKELEAETQIQKECAEEQERNADGYYQLCLAACDSFRNIMAQLDAPRLSRNTLKRTVQNAYKEIYKNL